MWPVSPKIAILRNKIGIAADKYWMRINRGLVRFTPPVLGSNRVARALQHKSAQTGPSFGALVREGQFFEAAALAKAALERLEGAAGSPKPKAHLQALHNRGESLLLIGKPLEAREFLERGLQLGLEHFGEDALAVAEVQVMLARTLLLLGENRSAQESAAHALRIYEKHTPCRSML